MEKRFKMWIFFTVLSSGVLFGAMPQYEIIDLGTLGGDRCYVRGINDKGHVVGRAEGNDNRLHPYIWDDVNGMTDLSFLEADILGYLRLYDPNILEVDILDVLSIDNYRQLVLCIKTGTNQMGLPLNMFSDIKYCLYGMEDNTIFSFDSINELQVLSRNLSLNDKGQIAVSFSHPRLLREGLVGIDPNRFSSIKDEMRNVLRNDFANRFLSIPRSCYIWDSINGKIDLPTWDGSNNNIKSINNFGSVVGESIYQPYFGGAEKSYAVLWQLDVDGYQITDLGSLGDGNSSALAINDLEEVAGFSQVALEQIYTKSININQSNGINHAFLWTAENGMIDIHDSHFKNSKAVSINNSSQVVGILSEFNGMNIILSDNISNRSAFYWDQETGMLELTDLISEEYDYDYIYDVKEINERGEIIGTVFKDGSIRAFLMRPKQPIEVKINIYPKMLMIHQQDKWVRAYIQLPEEFDISKVKIDSILLDGKFPASKIIMDVKSQYMLAFFNNADFLCSADNGQVEVLVNWEFSDGTQFIGWDIVRVFKPNGHSRKLLERFRR